MTVGYVPGSTLAHRVDPRSKLLFQAGFAAAAFAHSTPAGLAALTVVALGALAASKTPIVATLYGFRAFLPFLLVAPLFEAATLGPPYLVAADGVGPALASYRVVLLLLVSGAYVRTTRPRESRAALQRSVPGRAGVFLGAGIGFVQRFLPVLRRDFRAIRRAIHARLGDRLSLRERIRLVGVTGVRRVFLRADRFALALQARCFSWNPTLPRLRFRRRDVPVALLSVGLAASALL